MKTQNYLTVFINGDPFNCQKSMSLLDILYYLNIDIYSVIVEYNYVVIDKRHLQNLYMNHNDSVEVISIVGGG
uniref:Thiamin biosynthesis protein S n=1 Tax=Polysiphonia sertularioides TaxID=945028 RepID=A0A1Z1MGX0_9FLOR|nr:thiamin biosynthesis protein S [Polysiphonia sertularioides]